MSLFNQHIHTAIKTAPDVATPREAALFSWISYLFHSHAAGGTLPPVPTAGSTPPPNPDVVASPVVSQTAAAPPPVAAAPPAAPTLSLMTDGTIQSSLIEAHNAKYTGTGRLVHDFFFDDADKVFTLNKVQQDNLDYNRAQLYSPLGGMAAEEGVVGMMQAYSAVLVPANGDRPAHFDKTTVKAIDCALATRSHTTDIPAIVAQWEKDGYWPVQVEQQGDGSGFYAGIAKS